MSKLIIMRGIPGSGKSTEVQNILEIYPNAIVVNRDNLRFAHFNKWHGVDEDFITQVEFAAIRAGLAAGKVVISDNTHIEHRWVNDKIKVAYEFDAEVEIVEINTTLEVAITRNARRDRKVPVEVIQRMHSKYKPFRYVPMPTFDKYVPDETLPRCVLFDIDGTLAIKGDRGYYEWKKVGVDSVNIPVADVATYLWIGMSQSYIAGAKLIVFSGRDGVCRDETVQWLDDSGIPYDELFMRAENDMRPDTIVKMEMFDEHIRDKYNCLGVFDDRPAVVRQWLKHDIPVFHVDPYASDF